jgi:hypothetical protein
MKPNLGQGSGHPGSDVITKLKVSVTLRTNPSGALFARESRLFRQSIRPSKIFHAALPAFSHYTLTLRQLLLIATKKTPARTPH